MAKNLVKEGGTFVLKNVPKGSEFGIDMVSFNVGEKFKGLKMIPPGLHFINYSAVSTYDNSVAPKSGFFHFFKPKEMLVKSWDVQEEDVSQEVTSEEETQRFRDNLMGDLDQFLAPYDYQVYQRWKSLTDYISPEVVKKLNPKSGRINSAPHLISRPFQSSSRNQSDTVSSSKNQSDTVSSCRNQSDTVSSTTRTRDEKMNSKLPQMDEDERSAINFTRLEGLKSHPANSSAAEITRHSMDRSYQLEQLMNQWDGNLDNILGEIQFSFVCFLVGQVFEAFEHLKSLLKIVCSSDSFTARHPSFFMNFIRVLHFQLKEVPLDFFVDIVDNDNFLVSILKTLFYNIENCDESFDSSSIQQLKSRSDRFKKILIEKFKWNFDVETEDDDEAPVYVQLSDP